MKRRVSHESALDNAARIISALDSEQRLQIISLLRERDHVVHEIVKALDKSQPLVSQHLRVLKKAGLVTSTRSGREVVYQLCQPEVGKVIDLAASIGERANDPPSTASTEAKVAIAGSIGTNEEDNGLTPTIPHPPAPNAQ